MKALSVKQPWANMIARGEKSIETRIWDTDYRGDLLICSSKEPKIEPAGAALCIVRLVGCRPMIKEDEAAACCPIYGGAFSWLLADVRPIQPFPVRGQLRIFDVDIPKSNNAPSQGSLFK